MHPGISINILSTPILKVCEAAAGEIFALKPTIAKTAGIIHERSSEAIFGAMPIIPMVKGTGELFFHFSYSAQSAISAGIKDIAQPWHKRYIIRTAKATGRLKPKYLHRISKHPTAIIATISDVLAENLLAIPVLKYDPNNCTMPPNNK